MIKFNLGKFSVYVLILIICDTISVVFEALKLQFLKELYAINMNIQQLGQIIGALSLYLYQYRAFYKKENTKYFGLELIYNKANINPKDKPLKILILIFFASFFDFSIVITEYYFFTSHNQKISPTFKKRIISITTIVSSLLCAYSLNFKFGKHHKYSLIFMSVMLIIEIILEILMALNKVFLRRTFIFEIFLIIFKLVIISFIDCIAKYLYEFNYMNPFKILMIEGIFLFIFVIIFSVSKNIIQV